MSAIVDFTAGFAVGVCTILALLGFAAAIVCSGWRVAVLAYLNGAGSDEATR